jgi:hypothetical protein
MNSMNVTRKNRKDRKEGENMMGGAKNRKDRKEGENMMGGAKAAIGSKAQVFHGTAHHTKGGLTRKDLIRNKRGKIVSRKQAAAGKKAYSRLVKAGFKPKKGHFKLFTRKH